MTDDLGNAYDVYGDKRRRGSSYFPNVALSKGYSLDPRFTGILQPSPSGSYFNPSRYAGVPSGMQNRAYNNLATNYMKDLEFNRVANPNYQPTMDTGYSSDAQFGTGRASPATVQNYALKYGTPTGNGLSTFQTPSGGSITYKPSGRRFSEGAQPTVSPSSQVSQGFTPSIQDAYQIGFQGNLSGPASTPYQKSYQMGYGGGAVQQPQTNLGYNLGASAGKAVTQIASNAASYFYPGINPAMVQRATNPSIGQTYSDAQRFISSGRGPRRYFDE